MALLAELAETQQSGPVGQAHPHWCTGHDTDTDGSVYHRATLRQSDLVDVEVCQVFHAPCGRLDEPEVQIVTHDEPPLTLQQTWQILAEVAAALRQIADPAPSPPPT